MLLRIRMVMKRKDRIFQIYKNIYHDHNLIRLKFAPSDNTQSDISILISLIVPKNIIHVNVTMFVTFSRINYSIDHHETYYTYCVGYIDERRALFILKKSASRVHCAKTS